jgi:tetratricopeptide (TPR) repeat protein
LTAQLVDGESDTHLWSNVYPADMGNLESLFEIQAEIAMDVANALRVEFLEDDREQIERIPTHSREAYELYLASLDQRNSGMALSLIEQALALDERFVAAWVRKASLHDTLTGFRTGEEADAEHSAALAAANRALAIDPESSRAHSTLAVALGQGGDWIDSELEERRAVALGARRGNSLVRMSVGDYRESAAVLEESLLVDPMNDFPAGLLLVVYEGLGDKEARRRHWERGERLYEQNWYGRGMEFGLRLAEKDYEFVRAHAPDDPVVNAGVANLESPEAGLAALRSLYANPAMRTANNLRSLSGWAAYFGDPALALQWFREATDLQPTSLLSVWLPLYAATRREPGFKDLLRDFGVVDYWKRFGWTDFCRPLENDDFVCD